MTTYPNIRHLRALCAVAETGRISAAAEIVHLSQPAVTSAVSKLEHALDVKLFDRLSSGMTLTEIGEIFVTRVRAALETLHIAAHELTRPGRRGRRLGNENFDRRVTNVQLRALLAVADARNFSVAARGIGLSQPSLHRAARELEKLSGVTMFNVSPDGVRLTSGAQVFAQQARLTISELKQGLDEIGTYLGRDTTHIRVGSMPLARTTILPLAVSQMIAHHSGVQVQTVDGPYAELLNQLRQGNLDCLIGALRSPLPADDVVQETLFDDELAIIVGRQHPLGAKPVPELADTLAYPWVAPPRDTPAGSYLFDTLKIDNLPETPVRAVSSSLIFLRALLSFGPFVTIISPRQAKHEIAEGIFKVLQIELDGSSRSIGLTMRTNWRPTHTQQQFIDHLRAAARQEYT